MRAPVEEGLVEQALWWAGPHMIRLPRAERATSTPSWTVGEQGFRLGSSPCIEERCGASSSPRKERSYSRAQPRLIPAGLSAAGKEAAPGLISTRSMPTSRRVSAISSAM